MFPKDLFEREADKIVGIQSLLFEFLPGGKTDGEVFLDDGKIGVGVVGRDLPQ